MSDINVGSIRATAAQSVGVATGRLESLHGVALDTTRRLLARLDLSPDGRGNYEVTGLFQGSGYQSVVGFSAAVKDGLVRGDGVGVYGERVELQYFLGDATARLLMWTRGGGEPTYEWEIPLRTAKK